MGAAELLTSVGAYSTFNSNQFTGTGSQTDFTLTQAVEEDKSFVFIQGIYQEKSTYSISGTTLTFTTAPQSGYTVEVITVGEVSMLPDTIDIDNFSGTGSQVDYVLTSTPSTENAIDVYINGLYQQKNTFSLSGNTLTFSTAPPNGSTIEVKHQFVASVKGEVTLTAGTGISITKNSSNNFTISNTLLDVTVSFNAVTGQGLTYTAVDPISSGPGQAGSIFPTTTFTVTKANCTLSGTAVITGLPAGITSSQSYNNNSLNNILTITLSGVYPSANSIGTNLVISGLTILETPIISYLVVAGGGGGGYNSNAGGGGAGGYRNSFASESSGGGSASETPVLITLANNYLVTIGAGGAGSATSSTNGTNGDNSVFYNITSTGGGGGGYNSGSGSNGGSGGGEGYQGSSPGSAVTSPVVQGYGGGIGSPDGPNYGAGGGGGAGSPGQNGGDYTGNGGAGLASSITGVSITRASGGSGGGNTVQPVATPGGGAIPGSNAVANTGGGGGGGGGAITGYSYDGTNGGSGIVILRYSDTYSITVGAGLTTGVLNQAVGAAEKYTTFIAGTGNISFS